MFPFSFGGSWFEIKKAEIKLETELAPLPSSDFEFILWNEVHSGKELEFAINTEKGMNIGFLNSIGIFIHKGS